MNKYRSHFNLSSPYGVPKGARALGLTDTHFRDKDFKTIGNFVDVMNLVSMDIVKFAVDNNVTHYFHTGDYCDRGFRDMGAYSNITNISRKLSESVNGNMYKTIGNHFYLERDNNPAMYLIQPNNKFYPSKKVFAEEPIIKVVDTLILEGVQISFFHNHKTDKNYVHKRDPNVTHHIGIYHDDTVVPSSVRQSLGMHKIESSYLQMIYANVDEALVGHIHNKIGTNIIQVNGRQVNIDIPGSLCICKRNELHTEVDLPMWDLHDGKVTKQYVTFNLHADKLKFYEKKESPIIHMVDSPLAPSTPRPQLSLQEAVTGGFLTLGDYLRGTGQPRPVIEIIQHASQGNLNLKSAVKTFLNKDRMVLAEEEVQSNE